MKLKSLRFNNSSLERMNIFRTSKIKQSTQILLIIFALLSPALIFSQISDTQRAKIEFLKSQQGTNKDDPNAKATNVVGITQETFAKQRKAPSTQSNERCGFIQAEQMIKEKFPNRNTIDQFEKWMHKAKTVVQNDGKQRDVVEIPVVVHVIGGGSVAVSDAQVQSQITALTEDFTRMNADASNTPGDFLGVAANAEIIFCLATKDPDNNTTNGINRYDGGQTSYSIADMDGVIKPNTIWHPDFYFNIWCAPLQGGLLGYAQFPSSSGLDGFDDDEGPSFTDGIVVRDYAFGVGGSAEAPFNLGRTTTHEAGHFFGLRHIGGDGGCEADDFCADTPTQDGQNNNTEDDCSYPATNSCDDGEGDLPDQFMNYMDYSDDACMNLFTQDQKVRMDVVLSLSPRRASLLTSLVCEGVAPHYPYDPYADAPDNDLCSGAIPVECGDEVTGSTSLASPLEQPAACSPAAEAPGVWYSVIGDGTPLTASLCNGTTYDSKIGIYSGSCDALVCEGGDDDGCGAVGGPSTVTINTNDGDIYYVFVTGWSGSTGNYVLTITCGDEPPNEGPENDFCEGAISVECGDSVDGTTIGAVQDLTGTCVTSVGAPGVWFSIMGTGEFVTASLCDQADYDTKIHIIGRDDCDSDLTCVAGNDDGPGCSGFTSEVQFYGEDGQNYFIYVNGFLGETGNFTLSITCDPPAENDLCENAIALDCDSSVDGSTALSTAIDVPGEFDCEFDSFGDDLGRGVWYTIVGTGADIMLSACGTANYDTKIDVYTGECGNLECYAGNDDGPGCPGFTSELVMSTELGVTYYIYMTGWTSSFSGNTSVGDFTLNIECVCVADAGDCANVYLGYDPASCTDLEANMLYGEGPYEYLWSTGETSAVINVCPLETTTYSVSITDAEGCESTDDVTVEVIDVSCGNNSNKVLVCHAPPGNPGNAKTSCISPSSVESHLAHGDALGACETINACVSYTGSGASGGQGMTTNRSLIDGISSWDISPNPTSGSLHIELTDYFGQSINVNVFDPSGKVIMNQSIREVATSTLVLDMSSAPVGIYYVQLRTDAEISTKKLIVIK